MTRIVDILLRARSEGFSQTMGRAKDAVGELDEKVKKSAVSQRAEWATIGTSLTAVGVAVTGVGIAAMRTGVQYNTLQQTSRAALSTLLGSAEAANAQMDKLDAFARNSPFSKAVFIEAQQQLLGFGMAAEKVVPTLDAIQNAVAATGGSNQDIAELTRIIAQLAGGVKFSAETLNQFGTRGIDAAQLIGTAMGKTGAQIRSEITAGTLDADAAIQALTDGMQERFGGAAANVKNTFDGAMDRVKAAWRDFSAELATPLVDPNGGGALIDLLNWTADMMRGFQGLPGPVKTTVSALTGLVGVGALATGTAMLAIPKWLDFTRALGELGLTAGKARSGLGNVVRFLGGPWGVAMIAAGLSIKAFNDAMDGSKTSAQDLTVALKQGRSALQEMQDTANRNESGMAGWLVDVSQHLEDLPALLDKTAEKGRGFWSSMSFNENAALDTIEELGVSLGELAVTDLPRAQAEFAKFTEEAKLNRAQMETALGIMSPFKMALLDAADASNVATDDASLLRIALGELSVTTDEAGNSMINASEAGAVHVGSLREIQGAARDVNDAVSALADEIAGFGDVSIDSGRAAIKFEEQLADLEKQVSESKATLDLSTEAGRANMESLYDMAEATNRAAGAAQEAGEDQSVVNGILQRGRDALIKAAEAYDMSRSEAKEFADQVSATPETVTTQIRLSGYQEAITQLQQLTATRTVGIRVQGDYGSGSMTHAYGGTVGYASGGTIPGAANGMTLGIGGGVNRGTVFGAGTAKSDSVLVRLSKGEEVIQQPYAGMNRELLKSINRGDFHQGMIQPQVVIQGPSAPSLEGMSITGRLEIGGDGLARIIDGRIGSSLSPLSAGESLSRRGVRF